jgi:hypothetical protein
MICLVLGGLGQTFGKGEYSHQQIHERDKQSRSAWTMVRWIITIAVSNVSMWPEFTHSLAHILPRKLRRRPCLSLSFRLLVFVKHVDADPGLSVGQYAGSPQSKTMIPYLESWTRTSTPQRWDGSPGSATDRTVAIKKKSLVLSRDDQTNNNDYPQPSNTGAKSLVNIHPYSHIISNKPPA